MGADNRSIFISCYDNTIDMSSVKVSPKFQVVIPKQVREALHIKPGQRLQILSDEGSIRLVPVPKIATLRGLAKGSPGFERDRDRDL